MIFHHHLHPVSLNVFDDVDRMFLTVVVVIAITALFYRLVGRYNKPMVLGGLIAGVILTNLHLPKEYFDLDSCSALGNIGIVLFMMFQGTRFDYTTVLKRRANLLISLSGIILPFICGMFLARYIYPLNAKATLALTPNQFGVLIGLSMSITAFSLVTLFIDHSHLLDKRISFVAILAGATNDVVFWLILGGLLLYFQANNIVRINQSLLLVGYLISVVWIFPKIIRYCIARINSNKAMLGFLIGGCFISAILADAVNLHQIFGGFVFGLLLPHDNHYISKIRESMDDLINVFLLPIFFAMIGAIANIAVIHDLNIIWIGLGLSVVSFSAKYLATYFSSRVLDYTSSESSFLAAILNIRGVIEIVTLKVAWELGLVSQEVMTIVIIIALVTNWLATTAAFYFQKNLPTVTEVGYGRY